MRILLTEEELQNIVATLSQKEIKTYHNGDFKKWDVKRVEDVYALEYIYDEKGNIKDKFAISEDSE